MIEVVCLGILVADVIARPVNKLPAGGTVELVDEISLHGGGCALHTATALARFGVRVAVAGKVGNDPFGDFVVRLLEERGIDRRGVLRDPAPTSRRSFSSTRAGSEPSCTCRARTAAGV